MKFEAVDNWASVDSATSEIKLVNIPFDVLNGDPNPCSPKTLIDEVRATL